MACHSITTTSISHPEDGAPGVIFDIFITKFAASYCSGFGENQPLDRYIPVVRDADTMLNIQLCHTVQTSEMPSLSETEAIFVILIL